MAVYTEVRFEDAAALCARLGLGRLTALDGIRSGIENTNYYATTTGGQCYESNLPPPQLNCPNPLRHNF